MVFPEVKSDYCVARRRVKALFAARQAAQIAFLAVAATLIGVGFELIEVTTNRRLLGGGRAGVRLRQQPLSPGHDGGRGEGNGAGLGAGL
jgi:hypothetical protein